MRRTLIVLVALVGLVGGARAEPEGDPRRGAELYRACAGCHALEPGLHVSGPSLGDVFGRPAGTAEGFGRYSPGLKEAGFEWDAAALDSWLESPESMIPGNYMSFSGIEDAKARADLVAFLELAGKPGGGEKAVAEGLIPKVWLRAAAPRPIRDAPPEARVAAIRHCGDSYFIAMEDGSERPHWEKNIRLKIDSTETGPPPGVPVMLASGMQGDRFSLVFASLADLKSLVEEKC